MLNYKEQNEDAIENFEEKMYDIIGRFAHEGFSADRYDRDRGLHAERRPSPGERQDRGRRSGPAPRANRTGAEVPGAGASTEEGPAKGTVLEVKEEKGLGAGHRRHRLSGHAEKGDTVGAWYHDRASGDEGQGRFSSPSRSTRSGIARDKFDSVAEVGAAAGVKVLCQTLEGVVAGGPLRVIKGDKQAVLHEIAEETKVSIETADAGILIKADAIGSLEALAFECKRAEIPVRKYEIGPVSRRDVTEVVGVHRPAAPDHPGVQRADPARCERGAGEPRGAGVPERRRLRPHRRLQEVDGGRRRGKRRTRSATWSPFPGKFRILPNCVFRVSKPAIVGVRVLAGRIRTAQSLVDRKGNEIGHIRSIRTGEETLKEAVAGQEVAIAIEGPTVGRQIDVDEFCTSTSTSRR